MKKIVFLEGLPGVGKTTLLNYIKSKNLKDLFCVDEIIDKKILEKKIYNEEVFLENEELKLNKYNDGLIIVDRGPISVISYAQAKEIIDVKFHADISKEWFEKYKDIYKENVMVYYLIDEKDEFKITSNEKNSPYGTEENQKLLKSITEYNIKKYCKKYVFKIYNKMNIDEVVNEIIG